MGGVSLKAGKTKPNVYETWDQILSILLVDKKRGNQHLMIYMFTHTNILWWLNHCKCGVHSHQSGHQNWAPSWINALMKYAMILWFPSIMPLYIVCPQGVRKASDEEMWPLTMNPTPSHSPLPNVMWDINPLNPVWYPLYFFSI